MGTRTWLSRQDGKCQNEVRRSELAAGFKGCRPGERSEMWGEALARPEVLAAGLGPALLPPAQGRLGRS